MYYIQVRVPDNEENRRMLYINYGFDGFLLGADRNFFYSPFRIDCHKFSDINVEANLGLGAKVWAYTTICKDVTTGEDVVIGGRCYIGRGTKIGRDTHIQDGCHITDRMIIGERVFFGPCVISMNDLHPRVNNSEYEALPPTVEDDAMIGSGAILMPGVKIGKRAQVAAGAVVHKDVPDDHIAIGNPAKIRKINTERIDSSDNT